MKRVIYSEMDINTLRLMLEEIQVKGINQAKILVSAGNIIAKGKVEEVPENEKDGEGKEEK